MRARLVLGVALLLVAGALALDMSGRAPRIAGSDHTNAGMRVARIPGGGVLCEPELQLPSDAARAMFVLGDHGRRLPALAVSFIAGSGQVIASGSLPAGAREGGVAIPLTWMHGVVSPARFCLHVAGHAAVLVVGESGVAGPGSAVVDGRLQGGRVALVYLRRGSESWWQLLPTLLERFGRGKASLLGDWTLPAAALLLLGVWITVVRLLLREVDRSARETEQAS